LSSGVLPARRRADGRHQARFQLALVARFGKAGQLLELVSMNTGSISCGRRAIDCTCSRADAK
jgi:hypothetical protein